jgi:hypothetical protein
MKNAATSELHLSRPNQSSRGHGDKRSRKEHAAILAVLAHPTIPEAAKAAGISQATLWRWLQEDEFRQKYRQAQKKVFHDALGSLQGATTEAVNCLRRNLDSANAWAAVQSARAIFHYGLKSHEMFELEDRIEKIEAALKAKMKAEENERLFGQDGD